MHIINKDNEAIYNDLEKLKNREVAERFLKAQPFTKRSLAEMYTTDILILQQHIENLVNLLAKASNYNDCDIILPIRNGELDCNLIKVAKLKGIQIVR